MSEDRWVTPAFDEWSGSGPNDSEEPDSDGRLSVVARPKEDRPRRDFGGNNNGGDRGGNGGGSFRQRSW